MDDTYAEAIAGRIPAGAKLRKDAQAQVVEAAPAQIIRQSSKALNMTETRFRNTFLTPWLAAGEIDEVGEHESITLRLANGLRYQPDFPTWKGDKLTFYEVKGERVWEDAIKSLKIAANKYRRFRFIIYKYVKGEWIWQEVLP
jgi:hypothetical protein